MLDLRDFQQVSDVLLAASCVVIADEIASGCRSSGLEWVSLSDVNFSSKICECCGGCDRWSAGRSGE